MLVVQPMRDMRRVAFGVGWCCCMYGWWLGPWVTWAAHLMAGWDVVRGWRDAVRREQGVSVPPLPGALFEAVWSCAAM